MPVASPFSLVSAADNISSTDWRDLYTVPAGKQSFVKSVLASNTAGNSSIAPTLQLVKGSTQVQLAAPSLAANSATNLLAGTLVMAAGDKIRQKSSINFLKFTDPIYPNSADLRVSGVTWTGAERLNNVLFIYGYGTGVDPYNSVLFTSADGITWTWRDFNTGEPTGRGVYCAAYGGGVYVLGSESGSVFTSTDLVTWTKRATNIQSNVNSIAYGGGRFIAVGNGSSSTGVTMATSTDGINWSAVTTPWSSATMPTVAYESTIGMFAVTPRNDGSDYVYTSSNGTTWTSRYGSAAVSTVQSIAGKFVAVLYSSSQVIVSTDGVNFINYGGLASYNRNGFNGFRSAGGKLFAFNGTNMSVSSDGITWDFFYHNQFPGGGSAVYDGTNYLLLQIGSGASSGAPGPEVYKVPSLSKATSQACSFTASIIEVAA